MDVWGRPCHSRKNNGCVGRILPQQKKTMDVWRGPCHSFILSGICPRDCLDNGKCSREGFSSLRCGCGMSELTPPLQLSTREMRFSIFLFSIFLFSIFYFSFLQTVSGLLFRQWEWDAETHRGERRRTWTNPSTATEKGEERFPCRYWGCGADVTVMSSS